MVTLYLLVILVSDLTCHQTSLKPNTHVIRVR